MLAKSELPGKGICDDTVVAVTFTPPGRAAVTVQVRKIAEGQWMGPNPVYGGVPVIFLRDPVTHRLYPRMYGPTSIELDHYRDSVDGMPPTLPASANREFRLEPERRL